VSRVVRDCSPNSGGRSHQRLNSMERPIENKYREGKVKRTLKRELKYLKLLRGNRILLIDTLIQFDVLCGVHFFVFRMSILIPDQ